MAEVGPEKKDEFERVMRDVSFAVIGQVTASDALEIFGRDGGRVVNRTIAILKEAWQKPLRW